MRAQYPSNIRIVKMPCTGKVDISFILRTMERGVDGIYLVGCEEGNCHFLIGNLRARKRVEKAKEILEKVLSEEQRVLKDPASTIAVSDLADSSVNFVVRPWVKTADYWPVYFDLTEKVKMTFDAMGISIPFPQRDVHLFQQGSQ